MYVWRSAVTSAAILTIEMAQTIKTVVSLKLFNKIIIYLHLVCRPQTAQWIISLARAITHAVCSKVSAIPEHYARPQKFLLLVLVFFLLTYTIQLFPIHTCARTCTYNIVVRKYERINRYHNSTFCTHKIIIHEHRLAHKICDSMEKTIKLKIVIVFYFSSFA